MQADPSPILTPPDQAPGVILAGVDRLRSALREPRPVVVGITGPVGSGKTTLARKIGGLLISTDDYLPEYDAVPAGERDDPRHADLDLLAAHLALLRDGKGVVAPVWCFHEHRRTGSRHVEPDTLIVCEGIFALERRVRPVIDVAVYIEAPAQVRWARWERLEAAGERGWGIERARRYFEQVADPTFARFADEYRGASHIIVQHAGTG